MAAWAFVEIVTRSGVVFLLESGGRTLSAVGFLVVALMGLDAFPVLAISPYVPLSRAPSFSRDPRLGCGALAVEFGHFVALGVLVGGSSPGALGR